MEPLGISLNKSQSMSEVAMMLQQPESNFHSTISKEFLDAAEYRKRDSGSMGLFLDSKKNATYVSPRPYLRRPGSAMMPDQMRERMFDGSVNGEVQNTVRQPRLHGAAGLENLQRNRNTEVGKLLSSENHTTTENPKQRLLRNEAEGNAAKHRVGLMQYILNSDANAKYRDPIPQQNNVTKEAKENYKKHTGATMAGILAQPAATTKSNELDSRPESRCTELTRKNRRPDTCGLIIKGQMKADPLPEARVKLSGKEIYEKNRGTLTSLIAEYGRSAPDLDRPHMKRCDEKRVVGSVKKIIEEYGKPMPQLKPALRVRTQDAHRFAKNCTGSSMSDYFSDNKPYKTYPTNSWPNCK